jgi:hypothetical protein
MTTATVSHRQPAATRHRRPRPQRPPLRSCRPGRPFPGACHRERSFVDTLAQLTEAMNRLSTALVGEPPAHRQPEPQVPADGSALPFEDEDAPWLDLSVVELRALLRDLPIDRCALPAPIEYHRRHELLDALQRLPATCW